MSSVRKPVVAGMFYTSNKARLEREVNDYINRANVERYDGDLLGVITPHAGYVYSGSCAGYAFKALMDKDFDTAVIIAPSHRVGGFTCSVGDYDAYLTPLGEIKTDRILIEKLLDSEHLSFFPLAHEMEHSLEVQIPFLQVAKPEAKIVPIVLGTQNYANSQSIAEVLVDTFKDQLDRTAFIVSSDLSHYHQSEAAEQLDKVLIDSVSKMDALQLWEHISRNHTEACGFGGILTLLELAKAFEFKHAAALNYTHSGHTSGDHTQVVGYLSAAIYR